MSKKYTAIIDLDYAKYSAASVGEERTINVIHKTTGREKEFKTRTDFYGRDAAKSGGWLGELNSKRTSPFLVDEFAIIDIQTPSPVSHVLQIAKTQVENDLKQLGTNKYKAFLGKGDSFRVELSTLLKYKGNRDGMLKPLHMDAVTEYLEKKFKAETVVGVECDDRCVIEAYGQPECVILGLDKDYYGQPAKFFNVNRTEEGVQDCDKFGSLWLDNKGGVRGDGRMHLYWQIASNDKTDNYAANCFSDVKWAGKSAYKALVGSASDIEAYQRLENIFQKLYPESKTVVGWRGKEISIDWEYVLSECFMMAKMKTHELESLDYLEFKKRLI